MMPSEAGDRLTEDIASVVSPAEEQQFLRDHPDLQEAERLIRSAIAQEEQIPGVNSPYNVANGYNQLGQLYLSMRQWRSAIESIGRALRLLDELLAARPHDRDIVREISTAHFNLGEAYLSMSRSSLDSQHREKARQNYERSILLDCQIGMNSDRPQRRLKLL